MNHYNHLALEEREMIMIYQELGHSISAIARKSNRHKSTVSQNKAALVINHLIVPR